MKVPQIPPKVEGLLKELESQRFFQIAQESKMIDSAGRYLHWEQLRHKTPPPGMTIEEWWLGTHFARRAAAQTLDFKDTQGRNFFYTEPPEMKALLRYVDMNAGGVLGSARQGITIEDGRRYMRKSLAEEPFASSLIEGAVTTREIAKKMIFENRSPLTRDEFMVLNNYRGMEFIKSIQDEALTTGMIMELHRIMTENTLDDTTGPGRLRTEQDNINVVDDTTNEILHTPPPFHTLPERLEKLCNFANAEDDDKSYCHPLMRAMALHFMLAYDHPFVDGNGRTARALYYWLLLKAGYWLMEYTSISSVIADAPTQYYKAFLFTETDESDLTYFFLHQARVTRAALERMHNYADEKRHEFEEFQKIIGEQNRQNPLNDRQIALIHDFTHGREKDIVISDYQKRYSVGYLTARTDLEDLVIRELIRKTRSGKFSKYIPARKLGKKLFQTR